MVTICTDYVKNLYIFFEVTIQATQGHDYFAYQWLASLTEETRIIVLQAWFYAQGIVTQ